MKQTTDKISSYTVNSAILRNNLKELTSLHLRAGIGEISQANYDWHVSKCMDSANKSKFDWKLRTKLLDSILTHPAYHKMQYIGCVTQQLEEVN